MTETAGLEQNSKCENKKLETDTFEAHVDDKVSGIDSVDNQNNVELKEDEVARGKEDKSAGCYTSNRVPEEPPNQLKSPKEVLECSDDNAADILTDDIGSENKLAVEVESCLEEKFDGKKQEKVGKLDGSVGAESHEMGKGDMEEHDCDVGSIFEVGSVFVEFGRIEASCPAAHCLHGRLYDDKIVTVEYVPLDYYRKRFPK